MKTFADLGVNSRILEALSSLGFLQPTPVQAEVIPVILQQRVDLISLAQTGTGKTAAFGLPLIQLTRAQERDTQGLVLCPTRELCMQVTRDMASFSRYVQGVKVVAIYGGASIEQQIKALRQGAQIIVATPGRLNDLLNRGKVDLSRVRYVVFDEADEMLQMGFQDELNDILARTPLEKNILLFSATMSKEVAAIAATYMNDPVELTIGRRNAGAENVRHEYYMVHVRNRYPCLKRIIDNFPGNYSIVFCRTRQETADVAAKLINDGYGADALHGELSQAQRDQVMEKFRNKNLQILVATDVAARGLDVNDLTHVINYTLPDDMSLYTHRSGRTGRAGRSGTSVAIVHMKERHRIKDIEKKINKKFVQCFVPSGADICKKQLLSQVDAITGAEVDNELIGPLYDEITKQFSQLSREELIGKIVSLQCSRFLEYYRNAPDLNVRGGDEKKQPSRGLSARKANNNKSGGKFKNGGKFTCFALNVGRRQGLLPQGLIGTINGIPGVGRIKVGKIEISRNTALLEAESRFAPQILRAFQHATINGKTVSIEVAREGGQSAPRPRSGKARNSQCRAFKGVKA